jgi:hypothetical protein
VVLCPTWGLGSSFQLVIQVRIEATRSRIEPWAERWIHVVVSSANQRSTRLSLEPCQTERTERLGPVTRTAIADLPPPHDQRDGELALPDPACATG